MAANKAYCQKSSVCHRATSSSRSGSAPPRSAATASTANRNLWFSPATERAFGQEPLPYSLQGHRIGPAGPAPVQRAGAEAEEDLTGKVLLRGCKGASSLTIPEDAGVAGQPVEQVLGGGDRVLRCRPLAGRHTQTVGHNPRRSRPGARKQPLSSRRSRRPAVKTSWSDCLRRAL